MSGQPKSKAAALPETPLEALGPPLKERVIVDEREFVILHPADADRLLDHPYVHAAFAKDEYMPYWTDLWPASRMLAKVLMRGSWTPGTRALEVGCGLGLPGVVALSLGLRVTFSDYDATALRYAADNARLNGYDDFETLQLDWRYPPEGLKVPLVLAADLVYELRNVEPLIGLVKHVLLPDGECLLTDQDRVPAYAFRQALDEHGLEYTTQVVRAGEPGGKRVKGTLYRIRQRGPSFPTSNE